MKKILLPITLIAAICFTTACNSTKKATSGKTTEAATAAKTNIVLNNGQKITVTTATSTDIDMGMGQMKSSTSSTNLLNVIGTDATNYSITNTLSRISTSMEMMGQQNSYDSDKAEDKNSEMGKAIGDKINVADTSSVDRMTGNSSRKKVSPEREEKKDSDDPFSGMMGAMGVNTDKNPALEGAFFVIPAGKKAGDTWADSTSEGKIKTVKNYTLTSIDNNIATISVVATIAGAGESEMQGTSVAFTMNSKTSGKIIVNTKTSLVSKITNDGDVTMTMDMMGQSLPMSGKTSSTITYQ